MYEAADGLKATVQCICAVQRQLRCYDAELRACRLYLFSVALLLHQDKGDFLRGFC